MRALPVKFQCRSQFALGLLATLSGGLVQASAIVDAAEANRSTTVHALIAEGVNVNERAADGTTALHWAVYHNDAELVERLVDAGADVNVHNDYYSSPLTEAAVIGNADVIGKLLEAGADVESKNEDGQTALMIVARSSHVEAARLLLEHGADVNAREQWRQQTALMWAAAQEQPQMVALLLEHGAEADVRSAVNNWDRQVSAEPRRMYRYAGGMTPLLFAAREGCSACARELVEHGANIDSSDPKGVTPLFLAIDNFHFDTAKYLIEAGANPNRWDWWGRTPLFAAVDMNSIPAGGRPDRRSVDETSSLELVTMLLERGANPNAQLKLTPPYRSIVDDRGCDSMLTTGMTALLRATKTFDVSAMQLLIAHGARVDLPNAAGIAPIMAAAGLGSSECDPRGYGPGIPHYQTADVQQASIAALEVLLDAGADINARVRAHNGVAGRRDGQTALFGAASWGWAETVRFLVDRGASIDVGDAQANTAVDAAMGRAGGRGRGATNQVNTDIVSLLLELCAAQAECDAKALGGDI